MDQKLMREFVEKKLKRGGYTNIAAANFPCGVWIKEDTKLYAVCLFDDTNKLAADPWRIDRVVDYAAQKVREQKQKERFSDRFNGKRIAINRIPEVTLMLVILNILIQCIVAVGEIGGKESALMNMMVLQIGEFVQKPEWWRLVTSVFLHFGWDHLFNNMLVLLYLGALAERCIGKWRFLGVYLISGIGANAASVWWYVHQGDLLVATAGASGAIFGIAGLLICIVLLSKGHFEEITLRQLIFMMFFTLYHGFAESGVNNCAHIVGAIIGFVCGIIIFCQMKKNRAEGR